MRFAFDASCLRLLASVFCACGLWMIAPLPAAQAALKWRETTVNLKADVKANEIEARFYFTNEGKTAVDIEQVESSCGCTTAALERRHYEPGESGDIVARYTIGDHVGQQSKTIAVQSSDSRDWTTLTLNVDIPEIMRIRPAFVYWKQGEAAKSKSLTLELTQDTPIKDLTVQTSNSGMRLDLKETVKNHRFELIVTPARTDRFVFATLTILLQLGPKDTKTFRAYATVKAPEPGVDDNDP